MVSVWLLCHFISLLLLVTGGYSHSKGLILAQQSPETGEEGGCSYAPLLISEDSFFQTPDISWAEILLYTVMD